MDLQIKLELFFFLTQKISLPLHLLITLEKNKKKNKKNRKKIKIKQFRDKKRSIIIDFGLYNNKSKLR